MNILTNRFANLSRMFVFGAAVGLATSAFGAPMVTIGDPTPALPGSGSIDGFTGGVYADSGQTFGHKGTATSVTFNGSSSGTELTFMVGTFSGTQFTPTGIFNPISTTGGLETIDLTTLGIASGSAVVTAGETFGWTDQSIGHSFNGGSIYYADHSGSYQFFSADETQNETVTLNTAVGNLGFTSRDYSVNMTITTPEPSSFILCGLGALGLFAVARRRRKA